MKRERDNDSMISANWTCSEVSLPMARLSVLSWIGNAAAVLCGRHGDVTTQDHKAGCSRQAAYDHADKVQQAVLEAHLPGPSREKLLQEVAQVREENRQLWNYLDQTIDCPQDKVKHFTVQA